MISNALAAEIKVGSLNAAWNDLWATHVMMVLKRSAFIGAGKVRIPAGTGCERKASRQRGCNQNRLGNFRSDRLATEHLQKETRIYSLACLAAFAFARLAA